MLRFLSQRNFVLTEGYIIFLFTTIFATDLSRFSNQTGWVARGVLALLLMFSVISWAMIFQKLGSRRIRRQRQFFAFSAPREACDPQALATAGSTLLHGLCGRLPRLQSQVGGSTGIRIRPSSKFAAVTVSMPIGRR